MKSSAQRKQDERMRMRVQGYILRQIWIKPKDWPRVQRYLKRFAPSHLPQPDEHS